MCKSQCLHMSGERHFPLAAVLTGDLVASRKHDAAAVNTAMRVLGEATAGLAGDWGDMASPVIFDRYRGDGWQLFLPAGEMALRTALRLVAALAREPASPIATRIGVGLGEANLPDSGDLAAASGAAFTDAGDMLEALGRQQRLALPPTVGEPLRAVAQLLDWQSQNWTQAQAEALYEALQKDAPTQEQIAERFQVSRQAVQIRLARAGVHAIRHALRVYESELRTLWTADDREPG